MIDTALHYSGGKDSRAVLHLYRDQLESVLVVWLNTGAAYPQVEREMQEMARKVPHFLVVRSNQPKQLEQNGFPSDVTPMAHTPLGQLITGGKVKIQSVFGCCNENIWQPMHEAMRMLSIKRIIRGQRDTEGYRNRAFKHGAVIDGIECVAPLQDWTEQQVLDYLRENDVSIPDYYKTEMTGRDCWSCTAYLKHNATRIANLPTPQKAEMHRRLRIIKQAIEAETSSLTQILEAA